MLQYQIQLITVWWAAAESANQRIRNSLERDRGEVTATTAIIVLLVIAAIAAGGIIAARIVANANNVPAP